MFIIFSFKNFVDAVFFKTCSGCLLVSPWSRRNPRSFLFWIFDKKLSSSSYEQQKQFQSMNSQCAKEAEHGTFFRNTAAAAKYVTRLILCLTNNTSFFERSLFWLVSCSWRNLKTTGSRVWLCSSATGNFILLFIEKTSTLLSHCSFGKTLVIPLLQAVSFLSGSEPFGCLIFRSIVYLVVSYHHVSEEVSASDWNFALWFKLFTVPNRYRLHDLSPLVSWPEWYNNC